MSAKVPSQEMIDSFAAVADHSKQKCGQCINPFGCCRPEHCEETKRFALEMFGIELEETGHESIPFLGPDGCVVAPHLRPLCSVYVCEIHLMADNDWTEKYWILREDASEAIEEVLM